MWCGGVCEKIGMGGRGGGSQTKNSSARPRDGGWGWPGFGGGERSQFMHSRRQSHPYNAGTKHVGSPPVRQTSRAPSAKRREV